jgi:hypothetical protein
MVSHFLSKCFLPLEACEPDDMVVGRIQDTSHCFWAEEGIHTVTLQKQGNNIRSTGLLVVVQSLEAKWIGRDRNRLAWCKHATAIEIDVVCDGLVTEFGLIEVEPMEGLNELVFFGCKRSGKGQPW